EAELEEKLRVRRFRFLYQAGEVGGVGRVLLVDHDGHAGFLGEGERAPLAAVAVTHNERERILRGKDRHSFWSLFRRQRFDQFKYAARVIGLLISVAADDRALGGAEDVDADEPAVEQDLLVRQYDRNDRTADEGGKRGQQQIGVILLDQAIEQALRDSRRAFVIVDGHLDLTAKQPAALVHIGQPIIVDRLVFDRRAGERTRQPKRAADDHRRVLRKRRRARKEREERNDKHPCKTT